jgi:hypothetical protein
MATLLKVLNNLADIKSAGGVALRVRTQEVPSDMVDHITQALRHLCAADWHAAISDVDYAHITGEG